jgi:Sporulation and spore germination
VALVGVAALLIGAGPTACGVPTDDPPEPLEFPAQYQSATTTAEPPKDTTAGGITEVLCLIRDQRLVAVSRQVESTRSPRELLADLISGTTDEEAAEAHLSSALTGITTLSVTSVRSGIAQVEVGDGLEGVTDVNRLLIIGQIVCTLDAHPDVAGVRFTRDGQPLSVPRGDASVTSDVVMANDYDELQPSSATPTPAP